MEQKLMHVVRLRLTDEMREEIRRFMVADDRRVFDEACRHLLRMGLQAKRDKALGVELCETACHARPKPPTRVPCEAQERRRA
jgi:hypothetical protein